ncbi:MAG TPA: EamA family transporter [Solirubrobacteraceae bacterium]|nr:EamA family transporter [Solirubrobacteraceae bacterium]
MLAALLALTSSLAWGLSDFLGGVQSRRNPLLAVLVLSQSVALALLVAAVLAGAPTEHDTTATLLAVGCGLFGMAALAAFYHALTIGTMSVVAPISATGTAIPVLVGLLSGEEPSALQLAGILLAAGGVVLAAREAPSADAARRRDSRRAVALALFAAVGFGTFFAGIDRAEETADVAWVLIAARTADVGVLVLACAFLRPPLPRDLASLGPIAAVGALDLLANLLFVLAAARGLLSVVGVLGSLYPVVTVILARMVLDERLSRSQTRGVLITLAGVVALAAG